METTPFIQPTDQTLPSKKSFAISGKTFLLLITILYIVWFLYLGSLDNFDFPDDVKISTGSERYLSIIGMSLLYVALSPFAGFSYQGDTLGAILSIPIICIMSVVVLILFLRSL